MERALKPKYTTLELKKDIIETAEMALENRDRIKTVEKCVGEFSQHIQKHTDLLDPKLIRHDVILFGTNGDNGMVKKLDKLDDANDRLVKIEATLNKLMWTVILAVLGAVLKLVIIP